MQYGKHSQMRSFAMDFSWISLQGSDAIAGIARRFGDWAGGVSPAFPSRFDRLTH
jgi:hypothetical protein